MLSIAQALARVLSTPPTLEAERVPLAQAYGRVLAQDVRAAIDVPGWDNSAMDGYAVRAADTASPPVSLRINETIGAGSFGVFEVLPGTASAIMTGAPMPRGADAVVMVERTDAAREGVVRVDVTAALGEHVRPRGGDVAEGEVVLRAGEHLKPSRVGLIASLGHASVAVVRRPVVAILSTGDEIVQPGEPLGDGQIYSSNNFALAGYVLEAGGVPLDLGNAADTLPAIRDALQRAIALADVVLTTGGVSVGVFDFVKEAYAELGVDVDFWRVAIKPGKPLAYGVAHRDGRAVPVFGLPGNPVSCVVTFLQFVRPVLMSAQGVAAPYLPLVSARALERIPEHPGRTKLLRVALEQTPDGLVFRSAGRQSSGVLKAMAHSHGLLVREADQGGVEAGELAQVQLLDASALGGEQLGFGG